MSTVKKELSDLRSRYPGAIFMSFHERVPQVAHDVFIAPGAVVVGDVHIKAEASIWFNAVIRADVNRVEIGSGTNIQDGAVVHVSDDYPTIIGDDVVVGHRAIVHACHVNSSVLIGMGATILDGSIIESGSIIGANALVTEGANIQASSLYLGVPAKRARSCADEEIQGIAKLAAKYRKMAASYTHSL